VNLYSA